MGPASRFMVAGGLLLLLLAVRIASVSLLLVENCRPSFTPCVYDPLCTTQATSVATETKHEPQIMYPTVPKVIPVPKAYVPIRMMAIAM